MYILKKDKPFYTKKKFTIPLGIFLFLFAIRAVLPSIALSGLNKFLAGFSPVFHFQVADFDMSLIRGAYRLEGITGKLKESNKEFLNLKEVDVSMAWRELFRGKVVTDILVSGLDFKYLKDIPEAAKKMKKKDTEEAKEKVFPVEVERLDIKDSRITFEDYPSLKPGGEKMQVSDINGRFTNLTPQKSFPLSFFNVKAKLFGSSELKTAGHLNLLAQPPEWDFDSEVHGFDLTAMNSFLKKKLPLTFTRGKLDLYAEAKSEEGKIVGYIKPFMKNLDVVKTDEDFKGPKHWAIEVVTALGNLILRAPDVKSVATRIPFSFDKTLNVDTGEALTKAIEHGFQQQLSPGVEDKYEIEE
jgi:hypothetical protein